MEFIIFILVFVILFALGIPIAFSMIISAITYGLVAGVDLAFFSLEGFKAIYSITLTAIPMFMLTAEVMNRTTVADRMFNLANSLVGWIPGGLAHTNVISSAIFAGMSGSAAADTSGIGFLAYKAMKDRGFGAGFSAAVTAASAAIGPIIPPSIPVIVYTMTVPDASVGKLFAAGVIPGILMAVAMMVYIAYIAKKRNYPMETKPIKKDLWMNIKQGILPILTPVILLATISSGVVTVSEGAVVTVLYSCLLGFVIYRTMGIKTLLKCFRQIALVIGSILLFFIATKMFSYVLAKENLVNIVTGAVQNLELSPFIIMLVINVFFLIMGCLSDPLVNIMLFAPLAWSIAKPTGIDPNAFGMILIFNCMIGLITPPVGGNVFLIAGLTKLPVATIFKESMPFVAGLIIVLVLMSAFPSIVSFLPNLIMK